MLEDVNNSYKMEAQRAMKIECVKGVKGLQQQSPGADEQHPKLGQGPSVVEPTPEALVATVRPDSIS